MGFVIVIVIEIDEVGGRNTASIFDSYREEGLVEKSSDHQQNKTTTQRIVKRGTSIMLHICLHVLW